VGEQGGHAPWRLSMKPGKRAQSWPSQALTSYDPNKLPGLFKTTVAFFFFPVNVGLKIVREEICRSEGGS